MALLPWHPHFSYMFTLYKFETKIIECYYAKVKDTSQNKSLKSCRSPLKWAGGKYRLLATLKKNLPPGKRLVEPFVGSAVLLLNTDYEQYLLNDINPDLISFYQHVQQYGPQFIYYCKKFFSAHYNNAENYYKLRQEFNITTDKTERAALFLYLNRHAYNGLCRYNQKGLFNAPFGRYLKPYFPEKELDALHCKSQYATFTCQPFDMVMQQAKKHDVVYCDPPYVPLSKTANFTQYSSHLFTEQDQTQLDKLARQLQKHNIVTVISNHNTKFTRDLYSSQAKLIKFKVRRFISCNGKNRGHVNELLAIY